MPPPSPLSSRAVDSRRRVEREITTATEALGGPFKPYFGLSGLGCLPNNFVIRRGCDFFNRCGFDHIQPEDFSNLPQSRHPERSASQIYRLTEGLWRAVEGPRGWL